MSAGIVYLFILIVKALKKYVNPRTYERKRRAVAKSLGEALKENRIRCQMTQEFVAETLCVSRQSVSTWENGFSDPNTSNLIALRSFSPEELLNVQREHRRKIEISRRPFRLYLLWRRGRGWAPAKFAAPFGKSEEAIGQETSGTGRSRARRPTRCQPDCSRRQCVILLFQGKGQSADKADIIFQPEKSFVAAVLFSV